MLRDDTDVERELFPRPLLKAPLALSDRVQAVIFAHEHRLVRPGR